MMSSFKSLLLLLLFFFVILDAVCLFRPLRAETAEEFVESQRLAGKKTNRLIHEKSPYLLKHAFNPVDWYPWGDAPFRRAAEENKPVLLSIGYSTCHWCNVMEEESFDNADTARYLNEYFIAVKVDREERPDVDQLYMAASFALTGKGGWPLTLFLTPDRKPFFAGTYFPAEKSFGQPSFMELLTAVNDAWRTKREELGQQAGEVIARIVEAGTGQPADHIDWDGISAEAYEQFREKFDPVDGGFGSGSRFPRPVALAFLLRYGTQNPESTALAMVDKTLQAIADGALNDHLGGGFHRYSVDARWRTPHFEKMLYDQAQLASVFLDAYRVNRKAQYGEVARTVLEYVLARMTAPEGGFYSAEDADSPVASGKGIEKSEGAYYVWQAKDIVSILGEKNGALFNYAFGVEEKGNALVDPRGELAGRNILYRAHGAEETGLRFGISSQAAATILQEGARKLLEARQARPRPYLDDKIIAAWNGMMISSFVAAYEVFGEDRFLQAAIRATDFLLRHLYDEKGGRLFRAFRQETTSARGMLIDYACVSKACLDIFHTTQDLKWLLVAEKLAENMAQQFLDAGAFGVQPSEAVSGLPAKVRDSFEGSEPSGLAVAGFVCGRLATLLGSKKWRARAESILREAGPLLVKNPAAMPALADAVLLLQRKSRQIVLVGKAGEEGLERMVREVFRRYLPEASLIVLDKQENKEFFNNRRPETRFMQQVNDEATAYVCENFVCKIPTGDFEVFQELLR